MLQRLNKWCDIEWIGFLCVTAAVVLGLGAIFWDQLNLGAKGAIFVAAIMAFHVLEEWKFPGGLHHLYSIIFMPKGRKNPDPTRYPMSRFTDMITNVLMQWLPFCFENFRTVDK